VRLDQVDAGGAPARPHRDACARPDQVDVGDALASASSSRRRRPPSATPPPAAERDAAAGRRARRRRRPPSATSTSSNAGDPRTERDAATAPHG